MRSVSTAFVALLVLISAHAHAQDGSPAGPVPPALLAQRRAALLQQLGDAVVVLRSARVQDLETFPQATDFRQDDVFFYLTGLESADSWLVLEAHASGPDKVTLYVPQRDAQAEQWTGSRLDARAAAALSGVADVALAETAPAAIRKLLAAGRVLYVKLPTSAQELCGELDGTPGERCTWQFLRPLEPAAVELRDTRLAIAPLRLIKDEDELRRLRRAADITAAAIRSAFQTSKPGMWEYEIEAGIEQVFRASGAERVGFPSIVGSGPNSTVLHYDKSRRQTRAGDLVVMDVGAEFGYYTADVTRTMPISGTFSARQRALYDLVLATQQTVIDSIRPGLTIGRLDDIARSYMRRHSGSLCGVQSCDSYFGHSIGHWLGMDAHDVGARTTPFAPGMVLTVEPGVYLPEEALGIRIEDDVLVTRAGAEVLSAGAPRRAEDIEKLMSVDRN